MFRGRLRVSPTVSLLLAMIFATAIMQAQRPPMQAPGNFPPPSATGDEERRMQHDLERARLKKRAEEMQRDSERLVQLSTELKQAIEKAGENVLSLDAIRKAEEIEKLAHKIKGKMRGD